MTTLLTPRDLNFVGEVPHFVRDDPHRALGVRSWALDVLRKPAACHGITPYISAASCGDAPSSVCGVCAWQFLPSVFF